MLLLSLDKRMRGRSCHPSPVLCQKINIPLNPEFNQNSSPPIMNLAESIQIISENRSVGSGRRYFIQGRMGNIEYPFLINLFLKKKKKNSFNSVKGALSGLRQF